jgi:cell pole-organizing protein PopZ
MEEILASIRRILNDDDVPAEPADTAADDDVLVLDESMLVSAAEPSLPAADPGPKASEPVVLPPEAETPDQTMQAMMPTSPTDPREQPAPTPNLVAPETAAAAASSVGSLVRTLAAGRATQVYGGGPTLEDMVRAELRPLLKEWLDVNLPPMVERLVRAEIERVVGREVP